MEIKLTADNRKRIGTLRKLAERLLKVTIEHMVVRGGATLEKHECSAQWWRSMTVGRRAEDQRLFLGPLGVPLTGELIEFRMTFARNRAARYTTVTLLMGSRAISIAVASTICRGKRKKDALSEVIARRWFPCARLSRRLLAWIAAQVKEGGAATLRNDRHNPWEDFEW